MTRDYAKRIAATKKKGNKPKTSPKIKIILILIILAVFVGFGLWLKAGIKHQVAMKQTLPPVESITASHTDMSQAPSAVGQVKVGSGVGTSGSDASSGSAIDYQFYTLLSEIKVIDPSQDGQNLPGATPGFWLQMAVYYTEKDANAMVERLQLLGMNPDVVQRLSESSNRILYYVAQGPYATKALALQKQKDLQKLNLDSMIYEVKATESGSD